MGKKKIGCGCLGCSIPLVTFIVLLVLIVPLSVWGFMHGGLANADNPEEAFIKEFHVALPADVLFNIGPLPVTNTILATWVTIAVMLIIGLVVTRKPKFIPSKIQSIMEIVIEWLYNFCKDTAGEKNGKKFFPLVATIFMFVMVNALMNLIPGYNSILVHTAEGEVHLLRGANTDINTPLALAVISFVSFTFWGIQANKFGFFKQFFAFWPFTGLKNPGRFIKGWGEVFTGKMKKGWGDIGFGFIDIFVGLLELVSYLIRLISFTFRLFGNMLGGEILVLVFSFLLVFAGFGALQIFYGLEMFFGVIQALIFAGLTLVFSTMAVSSHDSEEHG